jgi:hypothetical protein
VLAVGDAVTDAARVVPEQLGQHGHVAVDQGPLVARDGRADRGHDVGTVEDCAVVDPR